MSLAQEDPSKLLYLVPYEITCKARRYVLSYPDFQAYYYLDMSLRDSRHPIRAVLQLPLSGKGIYEDNERRYDDQYGISIASVHAFTDRGHLKTWRMGSRVPGAVSESILGHDYQRELKAVLSAMGAMARHDLPGLDWPENRLSVCTILLSKDDPGGTSHLCCPVPIWEEAEQFRQRISVNFRAALKTGRHQYFNFNCGPEPV